MANPTELTLKNISGGPRGVHGIDGLVMIDAGASQRVCITDAEFSSARATGYFEVDWGAGSQPNPLDHDNDGKSGGSEPHDPPALKGKNKEALLKIAAAEGVEVPEGASNSTITKAIEAKRAAAAAE